MSTSAKLIAKQDDDWTDLVGTEYTRRCKFPVGERQMQCGAEIGPDGNVCEYHVFWTTKDGDTIPLREMGESHFRNSLNMILRDATMTHWLKVAPAFSKAMIEEARRRDVWGDPQELSERLLGDVTHTAVKRRLSSLFGVYWMPSIKANAIRRQQVLAEKAAQVKMNFVFLDESCPVDQAFLMNAWVGVAAYKNLGYRLGDLRTGAVFLSERRLKKAVHLLWPAADKTLCGKTITKRKPTSPENLLCPQCYRVANLTSRLEGVEYHFPQRKCLAAHGVDPVSTVPQSPKIDAPYRASVQ